MTLVDFAAILALVFWLVGLILASVLYANETDNLGTWYANNE
jgi:hypothetical protein